MSENECIFMSQIDSLSHIWVTHWPFLTQSPSPSSSHLLHHPPPPPPLPPPPPPPLPFILPQRSRLSQTTKEAPKTTRVSTMVTRTSWTSCLARTWRTLASRQSSSRPLVARRRRISSLSSTRYVIRLSFYSTRYVFRLRFNSTRYNVIRF